MAGIAPAKWLTHLEAHLPVAREGSDPEGVHQVRVAGRRLRVWLDLGDYRVLHDDLRWLVRGLGPARDLDVLCESPLGGEGPFAAWLAARRDAERSVARELLASPRLDGLVRALATLPPIAPEHAARRLKQFVKRARKAGERFHRAAAEATAGLDALHAWRRSVRRLRYASDWAGVDGKRFAGLQEILGLVCDAGALDRLLEAWAGETGAPASAAREALAFARQQMIRQVAESPLLGLGQKEVRDHLEAHAPSPRTTSEPATTPASSRPLPRSAPDPQRESPPDEAIPHSASSRGSPRAPA